MKILVIADAGCHSGFATVTHEIGERLVRDFGHDVSVIAINYRGDYWPTNLKLYPAARDVPTDITGMSRYIKILAEVMPDAIMFVNDPAVVTNALLQNPWDTEQVLWRGMKHPSGYTYKPPIIAYMPIDGYENPKSWDVLADRVTRVAMSHHGQVAMPEAPVIWHGVDTAIFHPRDKRESKRALGFDPDRFLVLRVDKNSIRKDYPSTWKALRPVLRRYPDVDVHFHCRPVTSDGHNLTAGRYNDEDIRDRVTFTPNLGGFAGMTTDQLATLYAAADLFVSTSWGEGSASRSSKRWPAERPSSRRTAPPSQRSSDPAASWSSPRDASRCRWGRSNACPTSRSSPTGSTTSTTPAPCGRSWVQPPQPKRPSFRGTKLPNASQPC